MIVEQFTVGGDRNFGYLVADEESGDAAVIDPCYSPEMIHGYAQDKGLSIKYVFNTHSHYDHTNGNAEMAKLSGVDAVGYGDTEPNTGRKIKDGAELPLGDLTIRVLHTPGHTPDSICIFVGDAVFTGDTLFVGKIGGTYAEEDSRAEYDALHEKLMKLPDGTRVFPGHNYGAQPTSTIKQERETNPFITQPDFAAFVHLKENWAEYKQKHGIK